MSPPAGFLNPSAAARKLGVSAKALRIYEARGLITPIRSAAGWRAYGPDEMTRASEIAALRSLGFSLAQIARVLGARVGPHGDGLVEIGYWPVSPTPEGLDFLARPTMFYQWHSETFEIPEGAVHLAENEPFPGQAFRYGDRVYGIEFHPEMTEAMIERWATSEKGAPKIERFKDMGAQPREAQLEGYERHARGSDRWLDHFLDNHLLIREREPLRAAI